MSFMKAVTLWQPWASLVDLRLKEYETRSWKTYHFGLLAIHAAKRKPKPLDVSEFMRLTLESRGLTVEKLPYGKVLCVVKLRYCIPVEDVPASERAFGDYSPGRFAWKLEMIHQFKEPIPARGFQGLWTWNAPENWRDL